MLLIIIVKNMSGLFLKFSCYNNNYKHAIEDSSHDG